MHSSSASAGPAPGRAWLGFAAVFTASIFAPGSFSFGDQSRPDLLGLPRHLFEVCDQLADPGFRHPFPEPLRVLEVGRQDLADDAVALGSEHHAVGSAVGGHVPALDQSALLQAVHQAGGVGAVHDQALAEIGLGEAVRLEEKEVQDVELGGTEIPAGEERVAGVPEGIGGAQELEGRFVPGSGEPDFAVMEFVYSTTVDMSTNYFSRCPGLPARRAGLCRPGAKQGLAPGTDGLEALSEPYVADLGTLVRPCQSILMTAVARGRTNRDELSSPSARAISG